MAAIRAIFDGKSFVPKEPVSLPADSEAIVLVDGVIDPIAQQALDQAVQEYYQRGDDADDEGWRRGTEPQSERAWDED